MMLSAQTHKYHKILDKLPKEVAEAIHEIEGNIDIVFKQNARLRELLFASLEELQKPWWKRIF